MRDSRTPGGQRMQLPVAQRLPPCGNGDFVAEAKAGGRAGYKRQQGRSQDRKKAAGRRRTAGPSTSCWGFRRRACSAPAAASGFGVSLRVCGPGRRRR